MSELPIVKSQSTGLLKKQKLVHAFRVAVFLLILFLIRSAQRQTELAVSDLASNQTAKEIVFQALPEASQIASYNESLGGNVITDQDGKSLGHAMQTSPECDSIIGYSGATNCIVVLDQNNKIRFVKVLSSDDTHDHVDAVKKDPKFLDSFVEIDAQSSNQWQSIDGATGATLTSYAIIASVAKRLSGTAPALKFNPKPDIESVKKLFEDAVVARQSDRPGLWSIHGQDKHIIGSVLTSTPTADHLSGYQGPTAFLIGIDASEKVVGIVVDQTYENQPYANYIDDDYGFQGLYSGKTFSELATMIPSELGIEGVSGATMTSMNVANGIPLVATNLLEPPVDISTETDQQYVRKLSSYWPDALTALLTLIGIGFSFSTLSKNKFLRLSYQFAVIVFLGFINGHIVSQALVAGWSASSIPWNVAPGLVFLSLAAFLVPIFSKHQPYCQHICPFGAIQQIAKNRLGWKVKLSTGIRRVLGMLPYALLVFVIVVAIGNYSFNLASIEPFDGFSFRVAGWATIGVFVAGLLFSLVSPMAYCRYGCPTGAAINFLRFRADSHRLGTRDFAALSLVGVALVVLFGMK